MDKLKDIVLDQNSVISLHSQLHSQLRQLILSGRWQKGSLIPSESQLTTYLKVSRSTVRLALQKAEIEGLLERIAGRGTFVNYLPKAHENRLIAFITYGFDAEFHMLMLKGAEQAVKAHGYQLILSNLQTQEEELDTLQRLTSEYVAGVLLRPNTDASRADSQNSSRYRQIRLPMVLMDRQIHGLDCDFVTSDNYGGTQEMMHHLVQLGHEQIVFLTHHEMELLPVKERYRAYCDVMREEGLTPLEPWNVSQPGQEILASDVFRMSMNANSLELQQIKTYLLNAQPRPTAIFALNDYLAVITMLALKQLDLKVPGDISLAGFDDVDLAAHVEIPLTTVAQDFFEIGKRSAQLLLQRLNGDIGEVHCEFIPTELRVRSSTSVPMPAQLERG
ncbi:MAG: GntR family transcriptional regulator [Chloroflexota bacterium]